MRIPANLFGMVATAGWTCAALLGLAVEGNPPATVAANHPTADADRMAQINARLTGTLLADDRAGAVTDWWTASGGSIESASAGDQPVTLQAPAPRA